jgi:hypothetical protein
MDIPRPSWTLLVSLWQERSQARRMFLTLITRRYETLLEQIELFDKFLVSF